MNIRSWLIIGLGNPGEKYAETRHNVGFMVADAIAMGHKAEWSDERNEPPWLEANFSVASERITVLKSLTYMNLSGQAIKKKAEQLDVVPSRCVVIADEYNFPVGRIHLRKGGSDGGHNGLSSVIQELNTTEFWRLRCGIGRDFSPGGLVDYVLSPFPETDYTLLKQAILRAAEAVDTIIRQGAEKAMQSVNRDVSPL